MEGGEGKMAGRLEIRSQEGKFSLLLDGTEVKDVCSYVLTEHAGKPPHLLLEVCILKEIEVQRRIRHELY